MADTGKALGQRTSNGGWKPHDGRSPFRPLTAEECANLEQYARDTTPSFEGPHNAKWEEHHPVAREVWASLGVGPK